MRIPLVYKPGIQRDGTDFQDEYCIDGQWIRFVDGKIRKMKGQQQIHIPQGVSPTYLDVYFNGNNYVMIYGYNGGVNRCITDLNKVQIQTGNNYTRPMTMNEFNELDSYLDELHGNNHLLSFFD